MSMRLRPFLVPFLLGFFSLALVVCLLAAAAAPPPAGAMPAPPGKHFEIEPGSFHFEPVANQTATEADQAGAHADWSTTLDFKHNAAGRTFGDVRNVVVNLPAGFAGNNTAVPTCPFAQLLTAVGESGEGDACPIASQVGQITLDLSTEGNKPPVSFTAPIYNMEVTSFGTTAVLGFKTILFTQLLRISVRPGDTGLTVTTPDITKVGEARGISVTIWGLPAAHEHDAQRGEVCGALGCHNEFGGPQAAGIPVKPFLSNPTSCGTFDAGLEVASWEEPENVSSAKSEVGPIDGCERVPFDPSIEAATSTESAESPTGFDFTMNVPQFWSNPETISEANLGDATVTLPEGITANPSLAAGLGACTPAQYASETSSSPLGAGCPPESKIGSILIETPLLAETIPGAIYIATPYDNPFGEPAHPGGSLLALYVVAKNPARGIVIKVAGKIEPNPVTGQLVTTFLNNPQQPFSRFTLKFRPGATAPLVSPPACGAYTTQAALTPWSAPLEPRLISSALEVTRGVREGPCPSGGVPPFHPQVVSGTQNNAGGSYSPFYLRILREDGEQEITRFSTTLPPGLTGNLSGIPFCPDAAIEAAKAREDTPSGGAEEEAGPSCPAASEIGHTIVEAGVGTVLAQTPGKVYLAGPYHGAPLSIVSITSARVGPFDLGTVVIRFALDINPSTAQVEVSANGSDPIPHIIEGIVIHVRDIRVYMNRPNFILDPTNCNPQTITNTIDGAGADPANPADQVPVTVTTPFEAADCSSLKFQPAFKVTTSGKTSKAAGASLTAKLTFPTGSLGTQSNIARVKVDLPKQLPSRLTTLQKACTAAQFNLNPAGCPAASVVGHATAITPLIPVPLEGPAYFVSHGGEAFPSLIVVLQGYGITIDLVGTTFISKAGITSSTFKTVPDQPVTSFELTLPEGKYSALAANGNLCKSKLAMPTAFLAQNGAEIHQTTKISVTGCPKSKKAKAKKRGSKGSGRVKRKGRKK
jgi:hypothetical protein